MTLREYLDRRSRVLGMVTLGVFLTVWVLAVMAPKSPWAPGAFLLLQLSLGTFIIHRDRARCPRCNVRLGYIDFGSRRFGRAPTPGLDRCLSCGLHLNEEVARPIMQAGAPTPMRPH
jgi:hypothetical protein